MDIQCTVKIKGMTGREDARRVRDALGVFSALRVTVDRKNEKALVIVDSNVTDEALEMAVEGVGFRVESIARLV